MEKTAVCGYNSLSSHAQHTRRNIMTDPLFVLHHIHKHFGGAPALRDATLEICPGEIHGLVGENGAGKSTLINIATGVLRADGGRILLSGEDCVFTSPRQAAAGGIAVVHQEADLFAQLSLAENMLLERGLIRNRWGLIDWRAVHREASENLAVLGERFDVRAPAAGLSVGRRMVAGIAAAVAQQTRVLFLDEPTASLTMREIESLFTRLRGLRDQGVAIVYVSHRLEEVLDICDRVTIMRDGETVAAHPKAKLTLDQIVSAMVGREMVCSTARRNSTSGDVLLRVETAQDREGAFRDISLDIHTGEIVGMYGFVGAGRSEFAQAMFGLRALVNGTVVIDGVRLRPGSTRRAIRAGLAYLPEDRLVQGVFGGHSVRANASVAALRALSRCSWISARRERELVENVSTAMHVRAASTEQPVATLSGGNQQKVVFGRWQATHPRVLLLDEPTRGVDVGAKAEIHRLIREQADAGAAVLLISSDLPEIMAMSDRVAVMAEGRIAGIFDPDADNEATIAAAAVPRAAADQDTDTSSTRLLATHLMRLREGGLLVFILALAVVMGVFGPAQFSSAQNFLSILSHAALPAIVAQGAILIICAGGIDISVGAMMGLVSAMAGLAANAGAPPLVCLGLAMFAGCALSLLNGATALAARIHPIIVTLAGLSIYRGFMHILMGGQEVQDFPAAYRALADGAILGIPKLCYYVIVVTLLAHLFMNHTLTGRRVLALGNSESAARLIGISKARITLLVFAISGALVGLVAVLNAGYYGKVQANTGEGLELRAIAAAVIGGTNILGGRGSPVGGLLGAFLVAMVYNMLVLLEVSAFWQDLFVGGLILIAVSADVTLQRKLTRASATKGKERP